MLFDCRLSGSVKRAPWLALLLLLAGHAAANPTGPAVAGGQATFSNQGNVLVVTNAPGTIINWQGFNIGAQDLTRFLQQSSGSAVLNRVIGGNASIISGSLSSNGQVYILSPNGVVFGPGSQVNTASLTLSTGQISNSAFLAGQTTPSGGFTVMINAPSGGLNLTAAQFESLAGNALAAPPRPGNIFPGGGNAGAGTVISPPPSPGSVFPGGGNFGGGPVITPPPSPGMGIPAVATVPALVANPVANPAIALVPGSGVTGTGVAPMASVSTSGQVTTSTGTGAGVFFGPPPITGTTAPFNPGAGNFRPPMTAFGAPPAIGSSASSVATTANVAAGNTASTATAAAASAKESPLASAPNSAALVILQKREPVM